MSIQSGFIYYGNRRINYEIIIRPKRNTLGIEVHPNGEVVLLTPENCDPALIESKIYQRAGWINRQIDYFKEYERHLTPKYYVSGAAHSYLGRQYRLLIVPKEQGALTNNVSLLRGRIRVSGPGELTPQKVARLLDKWYLNKAQNMYSQILSGIYVSFADHGISKPDLVIKKMRKQWGSLTPRGRIILNSNLIKTSKLCIEYVVTHELCHMVHDNHSKDFFRLLERHMPDWKKRKEQLERSLL